jgi:hypothetical protein
MCIPTLTEYVKASPNILDLWPTLMWWGRHHQFLHYMECKNEEMDEHTTRRNEVHFYQKQLNMEPRNDSALTEMYARGEIYMSAPEVARELMATDFIYKTTLYGEVIEEFMREVAMNVRELYGLSWTATWDIVRVYAPLALKLMLVSASGARIPDRL